MTIWRVSVRNDSWNYKTPDGRYRAFLKVANLEERLQVEIKKRADLMPKHPSLNNGVSQPSLELSNLHTFRARLMDCDGPSRVIQLGANEVPISFNDDLFAGDFNTIHCWNCQRLSAPEETWLGSGPIKWLDAVLSLCFTNLNDLGDR